MGLSNQCLSQELLITKQQGDKTTFRAPKGVYLINTSTNLHFLNQIFRPPFNFPKNTFTRALQKPNMFCLLNCRLRAKTQRIFPHEAIPPPQDRQRAMGFALFLQQKQVPACLHHPKQAASKTTLKVNMTLTGHISIAPCLLDLKVTSLECDPYNETMQNPKSKT